MFVNEAQKNDVRGGTEEEPHDQNYNEATLLPVPGLLPACVRVALNGSLSLSQVRA
jgi:hypothetical protein